MYVSLSDCQLFSRWSQNHVFSQWNENQVSVGTLLLLFRQQTHTSEQVNNKMDDIHEEEKNC